MIYIEMLTNDNEKYYVEGESQESVSVLFSALVDELNTKKFLSVSLKGSNSLFAIRTNDIKQALVIGQEELPLTQQPNFVTLITR
ncbi:hypothetical protein [uncultured Vagococcus sp.]|uniref:hypothetical protein n=1 Tax=uncultured Vagococcus sp. TaxID=189676 RepID=UPI0028D5135B|nr:hypothetical protein [uncultured Vagococcus sp.]